MGSRETRSMIQARAQWSKETFHLFSASLRFCSSSAFARKCLTVFFQNVLGQIVPLVSQEGQGSNFTGRTTVIFHIFFLM